MKKLIALLVVLTLAISLIPAALADTFVGNTVYCEAGYENDVYNGVAMVLTLNEDGTFVLIDNTSIIHNSYKVVTNWFYTVTGTYTVDEEEDGVMVCTLTATDVIHVMNGSVTTLEDDAELIEDYAEMQVECDANTFSLTVLD